MSPFHVASVRAYQQVGLETGIDSASPHRLVLMLFDGALSAISDARKHMSAGIITEKGSAISRAIAIIEDGLRLSLDMERGGAIALQLRDLYEYLTRRLVEANAANSQDMLMEISSLLSELRSAWVQIGTRTAPAPAANAPAPAPQPERRWRTWTRRWRS